MPRKTVIRIIEGYQQPVENVPDEVGEDWLIFNAPRPLCGHKVWTGSFRHGIFYAAIAPEGHPIDEFDERERMLKRTLELDGWLIVTIQPDRVENYARSMCNTRGLDYDDYEFSDFVQSFFVHTPDEEQVEYWLNKGKSNVQVDRES